MDILAELGGLTNVTAGVLLAAVLWMVFTGRLVPARYYNELRTDRDEWQAVAEKETAANAELLSQNTELIKAGRTTTAVLKAIPTERGST